DPTIKVIALERGEGSGTIGDADLDGADPEREPGEVVATIGDLSIVPFELTFSPDASRVAFATQNEVAVGALGSEDSAPGQELWVQPDISRAGVPLWSSDGRMVLTFGEGVVARLSAEDGRLLTNLLGSRGLELDRAALPGSSTVAVAAESRVTLLDTSLAPRAELEGFASVLPVSFAGRLDPTGRLLFHHTVDEFAVQSVDDGTVHIQHGHDRAPNFFQFAVASIDAGFLAGYDNTGTVPVNKLWSSDGFGVVFTSEAPWSIRGISRAGDLVVLGREGHPARLVRTDTGEVVHELEVGDYAHWAFFTPDDRHVLIGNNETGPPFWRLWEVESGDPLNSFATSPGESGLVANFSPDGSHLVLGRYDGTVVVYDAAKILAGVDWDEAMIRSIEAHNHLIIQTEISPDGRLLATNAWDEPAKLWRLDTGEPVGEFGGTIEVRTIAFHPTEPWVYVHDLGYVTAHTLDVAELISIAQATVTRPMTDDECTRYLGRPCP
ncbi:MAG: WD40 repeat domain-containing protein, partial [Acidimicrobiia bacterium]|nr:WD40 repeat domain-containing protein [Acidimicrobiia bacterium]